MDSKPRTTSSNFPGKKKLEGDFKCQFIKPLFPFSFGNKNLYIYNAIKRKADHFCQGE